MTPWVAIMGTISEAMALALQHYLSGNLQQAEIFCQQILHVDPTHPEALHLLGVIAHQLGKHELAVAYISRAIQLAPTVASFHSNLGEVYRARGQLAEAVAQYQQAIGLNPQFAEAYYNLGLTLKNQGRLAEAIAQYQQALRLRPDYAEAHNNLGNALKDQGRPAAAAAHYQQALRLRPDFAAAHNNLGLVLEDQGRFAEAMDQFEQAVRAQPNFAEAHTNLGNALKKQGRFAEAVDQHEQALRLKPDFAEAYYNLGFALQEQGRLAEAADRYRQALHLKPDYAEAHGNLGVALQDQGRLAEALDQYHQALRLPATAHARAAAHSNLLFCLNHDPSVTPAELYAEHRRWACQFSIDDFRLSIVDGNSDQSKIENRKSKIERRLRLGYVSPDFRDHPVSRFIEPVLAAHNHEQFEIVCYADVFRPDAVTQRIQHHADTWRSIAGSADQQVADCIRHDAVDILVDLTGHTARNRLLVFARKPAPVQVTYLGYPSTTGLTTIDYRLTDALTDPPGEPVQHSEELMRLPGTFCCYAPRTEVPNVTPLPAGHGGRLTFGSLHKLAKLNAQVIDLWCRLLHTLPEARLLIAYHTLSGQTAAFLGRQFMERGLARDRLDLRQAVYAGHKHLELYREIDVILDTFPWSGHATTCEALWMGVPVLTLYGKRYAGRMTASILTCLGLTEFVAATPVDYVAGAIKLAGDLDRLAQLRATLREKMRTSPLCDGATFTRDLETAYRVMWQRWCR